MTSLSYKIYQTIYPLKPSNRVRDRPMQVLALGLSRTGTDSLRAALQQLGYDGVYHGWEFVMHGEDCVAWCEIDELKRGGKTIDAKTFDRVLGQCVAVTDMPCPAFANDLIAAYPDAKIILNHRQDLDAWVTSVQTAVIDGARAWAPQTFKFFHAHIFWLVLVSDRIFDTFFGFRTFRTNGKQVYQRHYENVEKAAEGRQVLRWYVQDGWEPLCKFLDKPVPDAPFPSRNALADLEARALEIMVPLYKVAAARMVLCLSALVALAAYVWYCYIY